MKKKGIISVIIICLVAIGIISFFVFRYAPLKESFSELYFEDQEKLPAKVEVGKERNFTFTVASHKLEKSSYRYAAKFDNEVIKEGTFILLPQESKTIKVAFVPGTSSMTFVNSKTDTEESSFTSSNILGFALFDKETGQISPIYKTEAGNLIIPVKIPYSYSDKTPESILLLQVNPKDKKTFHFHYTKKLEVEDKVTKEDSLISPIGYNIISEEQTISNSGEKISFIRKVTTSQYRYEKKKVSVEVSDGEKDYEIHFWVIVEESE